MIQFQESPNDPYLRFWLQNKARHYVQGWFHSTNGQWCIEFAVNATVHEPNSVRGSFGGCIPHANKAAMAQWMEAIIETVAPDFVKEVRTQ